MVALRTTRFSAWGLAVVWAGVLALTTARAFAMPLGALSGSGHGEVLVHLVRGELSVAAPVLGPFAHARFCLQYPGDCESGAAAAKPNTFVLNAARWNELGDVNRKVNRSIRPERNEGGVIDERWRVWPPAGDCNDYAVTKRHALLERGWPTNVLLLAEVLTRSGEHHLVLVVRARNGDFVLDNMTDTILTYARARYQWLRVQSPRNPKFWFAVKHIRA
jgi:predicted transglutaminase-like cysteine proteinase